MTMSLTHWGKVIENDASYLDNIGSDKGFLPDSTNPLPDPMLNNQ